MTTVLLCVLWALVGYLAGYRRSTVTVNIKTPQDVIDEAKADGYAEGYAAAEAYERERAEEIALTKVTGDQP